MPLLHFNPITCMHLIVCIHYVQVHIQKQLVSTNLLHDKHFLAHVEWVSNRIFKIFIYAGEMVMLVNITIIMSKHGCTMVWPQIFSVNINEKTLVLNNDCVVHWINFFSIIESSLMLHIIPQLANFHKSFVNEPDTTLEVSNPLHQGVFAHYCDLVWKSQ
jgi:hypothetical protein